MNDEAEPAPRRVAVVAVHGVADQQPSESARQIAALLQSAAPEAYGPFAGSSVRIAVTPLEVEHREEGTDGESRRLFGSGMEERPRSFRPEELRRRASAAASTAERDTHYQFFLNQVERFRPRPAHEIYETPCLRSRRRDGSSVVEVRVFELYWADLSRLSNSFLRIFGELFQLVVHLASLGRHAVDQAGAAGATVSGRAWTAFAWLHRQAVRVLTLPAFLLNVLLVGLVVLGSSTVLPTGVARVSIAAIAGLALGAAAILVLARWRRPGWSRYRAPLSLLPAAAAATASFILLGDSARVVGRAAYGSTALLVGFAFVLIARSYDRRRPGALRCAVAILVATGAGIAIRPPAAAAAGEPLKTATLHLAELLFVGLGLAWALFVVFQLGSWVAAIACRFAARRAPAPQRDATRRAAWTAHVTLVSTAMALVLCGFVLWAALAPWFVRALPSGEHSAVTSLVGHLETQFALRDPLCSAPGPLGPDRDVDDLSCTPAGRIARAMLYASATPLFAAVLAFVGGAFVLIVWGLLPSALWELGRGGLSLRDPERLGLWLDSGFRAAALAGCFILFAVGALFPYGLVEQFFGGSRDTGTFALIAWIGGGLTGTFVALLALRGRARNLALGLRPALDVLLDIDNHLRLYPLENNPRARIAARYVSFLRFLASGGFDSIVIVAHSQGTVISADVLRFLQMRHRLGRGLVSGLPRVRLFTMGSPLRQLYGLRFPHLYSWARHDGGGPVDERAPDPAELLAVEQWVNAYASGDYVGRHLWRDDDDPDRFGPAVVTARQRKEYCLGPQAHTHYWDGTLPEIGAEIDRLVRSD